MSENDLSQYRQTLVDNRSLLNQSYDKLIVTLSGGALAVSISLLKDVITLSETLAPWLLLSAWAAFVVSLGSILGGILLGMEAHKRAISQVDDGTIYDVKPGGGFSYWSTFLQRLAAISLVVGLSLLSTFTFLNIGEAHDRQTTLDAEFTAETNTTPDAKFTTKASQQANN